MKNTKRQATRHPSFLHTTMPKISTRGWLVIGTCFATVTMASVIPLEHVERINQVDAAGGNIVKGKITREGATGKEIENKAAGAPDIDPRWSTIKLRRGDSLARVLQKEQITKSDRNAIITADIKPFKKLVAGNKLGIFKDQDGVLQEVRYAPSLTHSWRLYREKDQFQLEKLEHQLEVRQQSVVGEIKHSLFVDGQRAGLSVRHIMNLAEIFGWDIDFALDLRKGDRFTVIYEEKYYKNKKAKTGNILAAEIINRGETYRAIAHRDDRDNLSYYTPEGESLRRTFLRSPVKFSYISSRFTKRRYHPVLKRWRAHKGVDYAARSGTPVRSTASGKIIFVGRKGGYGKTVIIKHGGNYSTLYAHLSKFKRRLRKGQRIRQGQLIAYVGATGLASGPHLHYEFRVNNRHRNPLRYRFPKSSPIAKKYMQAFLITAKQLNQELDALGTPTQVAKR
jgi:murein DD-endopeptidase MepM/ murein hydrolase activator NlpD